MESHFSRSSPAKRATVLLCRECLAISKHGIEDGEEFSCDSYNGEFLLAGCDQGFVEGFETGSVACRDEGGHVEGIPDPLTAAPDGALAPSCSAVVVEGRQSTSAAICALRASIAASSQVRCAAMLSWTIGSDTRAAAWRRVDPGAY